MMTFVTAICFGRATDSTAFFGVGGVGFRTANCGRGADRRERRLDIAILRARSDWVDAQRDKKSRSVKDGLLTAAGPRSHLFYSGGGKEADFKNFELKVEVMRRPRGSLRKACGGSRYSTPCKRRVASGRRCSAAAPSLCSIMCLPIPKRG